jgi:hypothetical protein
VSFEIFMGEPEMLRLWNELLQKAEEKTLDSEERELFEKWTKALELLSENPRHPGLASHEIDDLSKKYGIKVWQSYLENRRAGARRMFWAYGPGRSSITILGLEKHPNTSKQKAYKRISLDRMPKKQG